MNQYAKNACGTIALVHLILNAAEEHPDILNQGSFLNSFWLPLKTKPQLKEDISSKATRSYWMNINRRSKEANPSYQANAILISSLSFLKMDIFMS